MKPTKKTRKLKLDPNAPGLDDMTRQRRRILAKMQVMTPNEVFEVAVAAGIYTKDGKLTPPYCDDAGPSAHRPTD